MTEPVLSRRLDRLLESYGAAYPGFVARALLFLAVPLLVWSCLALLLTLPTPAAFTIVPGASYAAIAAVVACAACLALSWRLAIGLAAALALALAVAHAYLRVGTLPLWQMALTIFALAVVLLIVAQRLGGRRADPLRLVNDLLVGPLWVISALYRVAGLRT